MKILACVGLLLAMSCNAATPWDELLDVSYDYLNQKQEILESEYGLSNHGRWDYDQITGELVFSNDGKAEVVARVQFVGSFSFESKTWLWGWANSSVEPKEYEQIVAVKKYGEQHHFEKLVDRKWPADEVDGWEMAAVANYLLKGKGVYRPPSRNNLFYLVITDIRKVAPL